MDDTEDITIEKVYNQLWKPRYTIRKAYALVCRMLGENIAKGESAVVTGHSKRWRLCILEDIAKSADIPLYEMDGIMNIANMVNPEKKVKGGIVIDDINDYGLGLPVKRYDWAIVGCSDVEAGKGLVKILTGNQPMEKDIYIIKP